MAFVSCRPSFWGNIFGKLMHYLASRLAVHEVLYFGKLSSVNRGVGPNTWLVTGGLSLVRGQPVEWENVLDAAVARLAHDVTLVGSHVTVDSVLHKTHDWLAALPASVDFVDPEIGMMAQAVVRSGIRFGYLHMVSDNVAEKYEQDLSNERMRNVLSRRLRLIDVVQDVLGHHLSTIP